MVTREQVISSLNNEIKSHQEDIEHLNKQIDFINKIPIKYGALEIQLDSDSSAKIMGNIYDYNVNKKLFFEFINEFYSKTYHISENNIVFLCEINGRGIHCIINLTFLDFFFLKKVRYVEEIGNVEKLFNKLNNKIVNDILLKLAGYIKKQNFIFHDISIVPENIKKLLMIV